MINTLNKTIVNDTFNRAYNEEQFKLFIKDLLLDSNFEKAHNIMLPNDYKDFIKSARRICKYKYTSEEFVDDKVIDVLVVKLKKTTSVERARVAQRNFVARYLNGSRDYQKDGALVAFISEDENGNISPDWRFSFVQMNYKTEIVEKENGKKKRVTSVELTPAKRFSFLVGENEDTHTAQRQFATCLEKSSKGEKITIEDLVQAFDIEKVSKEFFDKYKTLYLKLRDELIRLCDEDKIVKKDFEGHNINVDDFAKKTLGQLVFLYFIQKKGWLGVEKDKDWGTGDKKFLRKVFDKGYGEYDNFFNDVLEHLFYEALAIDRGQTAWFDRLNCRIPFLNGGLFEPVNGYEWTKTDLTIDNKVFKEIFDTFDLYNFTVKEDEPLEKEVAIDPEMLGKVFENLLPENERKGNGAFYTPREIVHYMCQESLINYLYNKINIKEVPLSEEEKSKQLSLLKTKKEKEQLKLTYEVIEEIISKEDIEFLIKTGNSTYINKQRKINVVLPDSIRQNANILDNALSDIKVCDPAIGSGAFPVGMMNEIVRARATLSEFIQPDRSIYQLKRQAIENSIYGVDIDPGAVDIAKLRFWLSLVVDEEDIKNIKPLPNLDYKIMQGNSLITSYEGIDFDEIVSKQPKETQLDLFSAGSRSITEKISKKQNEFLNTPYPTHKGEIKQEIEDLIFELVKTKFEEKANKEGKPKDFYEEQIRNFAQNKEKRNFFPWKLFFADVFENGGFDVVIGNPPYFNVQTYGAKHPIIDILKKDYSEIWMDKSDILFYFIYKAYQITQKRVNYIVSNAFLFSDKAKKLRNFIVDKMPIKEIINFEKYMVFDSASITSCIVAFEKNNIGYNETNIINFKEKLISKSDLEEELNNKNSLYTTNFQKDDVFSLEDSTINALKLKIDSSHDKLGNILKVGKGMETAANEVFSFDFYPEQFPNEYIKYRMSGEIISKYRINKPFSYMLYFEDVENFDDLPFNIQQHLLNNKTMLENRATVKNEGRTWWRYSRPLHKNYYKYEKIWCSYRAANNQFVYDGSNQYIGLTNTTVIFGNNPKYEIKYVLALLNSKVLDFRYKYIGKQTGSGIFEYFENQISKLPIPNTDKDVQLKFVNFVNKILELTLSDDYSDNLQKQQAVKEYENQIDIMVYKLYNLTYEEVLTIDPDFTLTEEEYNNYKY